MRVWCLQQDRCIQVLDGHTHIVFDVAINYKNGTLASASADNTVRVWDIDSGECVYILKGHRDRVRSVVFHPNQDILFTCSDDKTIKSWDSQGNCIYSLEGDCTFSCIDLNSNGSLLVSGDEEGKLKIWNTETWELIHTSNLNNRWISSILFSPDMQYVAFACGEMLGTINVETHEKMRLDYQPDILNIYSIAYSSNGELLASSCGEVVKIWNVRARTLKYEFPGNGKYITALTFVNNDQALVSTCRGGVVTVWSLITEERLKVLRDRPYEGMNITGVKGLTEAEAATLKALGAIEN